MGSFDYIIVGAGSAGCVLADNLSRDGRHRVLVLEAGGSDDSFWIRTPIGYGRTFADARVNWKYETQPEAGMNGRRGYWPRGRVVGGSSSINALVYFRGLAGDFDDWRDQGAPGWGWQDVRPYFERSERRVDADGTTHGSGALYITDVAPQLHRTCRHFFDAARQIGLPVIADLNADGAAGLGHYVITTRDGRRCSAADAFLRPALARPNTKLECHAWVSRVRFEGRRAVGVDYSRDGRNESVTASRGVILAAGAVNSPQLLQLSGIGPGALLQRMSIPVLLDSPVVGGWLQDHLAITYSYRATEPTLNGELHSAWGKARAGLHYLLTRKGLLSLSVNHAGGLVRGEPGAERPEFQLYYNPITYAAGDARRARINPDPFPGFMLSHQPSRPTSRGRIELASPDFREAPAIRPNYLATEKDRRDVIIGARLLLALQNTQAMRGFIAAPIGPELAGMDESQMLADFRARAATVYHPVGTCRMGQDPATSVVDPQLEVHGLEHLFIADASVFPNITSANTNAPTLMVAQKASDLILAASRTREAS